MKKIDVVIILTLVITIIVLFCYSVIFYLMMTIKVISIILFFAYCFFIILHLMLCYPLFAICMIIRGKTRDNNILKSIENKSKILWAFVNLLMFSFVLCFIYLGIPLIIAMLYNGSISVDNAVALMNENQFFNKIWQLL